MAGSLHTLPAGLPVPVDDGATAHLAGAAVPAVTLVLACLRERRA